MNVLITNNRLDFRGGAESFTGDLARGLQRQGHRVLCYSSDPGNLPRMLEHDGIPVACDLAGMTFKPDILHCQHHMDAMTALAYLPGVPAVYHCHGAVWREVAPFHPRIRKYLAMSETLRERMMIEGNIPGGSIEVVLNSVDLDKFRVVRDIPARPRKALFYNGHHRADSPVVVAAAGAAARQGMEFETLGFHFGRMTGDPAGVLRGYDMVFASGRSAIDAMACGCAVVVIGRSSCAELVTPANFGRWRAVNFSAAANLPPPTEEGIAGELARYDAAEVAETTRMLREEADSQKMVRRLVGIYESVAAGFVAEQADHQDPWEELRAMADYLRRLVPVVKMADAAQREQDFSISKTLALRDLQAQMHRFLLEMDKFP